MKHCWCIFYRNICISIKQMLARLNTNAETQNLRWDSNFWVTRSPGQESRNMQGATGCLLYPPQRPPRPPSFFFFLSPEKQRHCVGHKGTVCSLMRSCRDRACGNTDALGNTAGLGNFSRRNPKNRTVKITLGGQTAERSRDRAALSSGFTVWNTQDPKG